MVKNKRVVITGGGRGLGLAFAQSFLEHGAKVTITGRDAATLAKAAETLGGRVRTQAFDISDAKATKAAFEDIHQRQGAIDVLVNNAGSWGPIDYFWNTSLEEWQEAMDINVKGPVYCTHAVLKHRVDHKVDSTTTIINITSNAGAYRWPTAASYSISRAAIIKLTENLAFETRRQGVSLFAYHPGLVLSTGLVADGLTISAEEGTPLHTIQQWVHAEQKAGRTVSAEQGARNLLRLASGGYSALSGCYLTVQDDLDALLADQQAIRADGLLTLRVKSRPA
ncbi:SDR family NAD(P)-dependent oxidoreductase [Myxococcus fulvus]|uniref:SDR family NAD(P)-dependent oxidoreductase n=1 Tax=Myxococcus fulvus TaxID=33 RepID=UPI003B996E2D